MAWTTLTLQVTTPLFNGGADPGGQAGFGSSEEAGVRVAPIRGAMRFWFRALAGTVAGPDLRLLAGLERQVFGDAGFASPVQLRVPSQPRATGRSSPEFLDGETGKWITYLLGQGLTKYDRNTGRFLLTRSYLEVGQEFDLKLRFTDEDSGALALAALRLCCMYGGLGARVRRGFGGVRIIKVDGPLPGPWTETALKGKGLTDYAGVRSLRPVAELAACRGMLATKCPAKLRDLDRPADAADFDDNWAGPPPYPVLSADWSLVGLSGQRSGAWQGTLRHAGEQLRHFRASEENGSPRARYSPRIETPEWLDVVHGPSDRFAVGALGLPVVYKDGYAVNVDRGSEKLRRASPLWLRAVESKGEWRLLSFAFLGQFLPGPDAPGVHLWNAAGQGKRLSVAEEDVRSLTGQWITQLRADRSFTDAARRN